MNGAGVWKLRNYREGRAAGSSAGVRSLRERMELRMGKARRLKSTLLWR